ncbi:PH domain-containing protein [Saccharopolyspora sp. HNM0983]|uniref:PH domain-containing protein n=1 Tax=Saccharopolyspora montiporae TaxID=2781240 RepID=A0A929G1U9_9PSEU|nr:PH domain-containing protein [Saccharopolyspora sp. HNM0983]
MAGRPGESTGRTDATAAHTPAEEAPDAGTPADGSAPRLPASLTFRTPRVSVLAVLAIAACATPLATTAGGWALLVYLFPLALLVWLLRTGTTVTAESVTARTVLGRAEMPWDEIGSLRVHRQARLQAVLRSGKRVTLPSVRPRDLPRFAMMSGGRLPDPYAAE